jgi:succinate dehydrogenase flavin-adding protein (antitoxin of CptAB toxin-antitoxin module)
MRELDAVLAAFADRYLGALDAGEISLLERILDLPDPELHAYLVGGLVPEDPRIAELIDRIRNSLDPETGQVP